MGNCIYFLLGAPDLGVLPALPLPRPYRLQISRQLVTRIHRRHLGGPSNSKEKLGKRRVRQSPNKSLRGDGQEGNRGVESRRRRRPPPPPPQVIILLPHPPAPPLLSCHLSWMQPSPPAMVPLPPLPKCPTTKQIRRKTTEKSTPPLTPHRNPAALSSCY